ncbi:MAG: hypothetical protein WAX07_04565 [Candidatus Altiarchaeia archaeon]
MTTQEFGRNAQSIQSIDEMMMAYVAENAGATKTRGKTGESCRMHGIDLAALDLPENATLGEIRAALRMRAIELLDLSDDTSDEEITEEINARRALELEDAIASGNYDKWLRLIKDTPGGETLAKTITRDKFRAYREMRENVLMAEEIALELKLPSRETRWIGRAAGIYGGSALVGL